MAYRQIICTLLIFLGVSAAYTGSQPAVVESMPLFDTFAADIYNSLGDYSLNSTAFSLALLGQKSLIGKGLVQKTNLLTVIDFSRPSNETRFFVIDLFSRKIIFKTLVAHGRNSGDLYASRFSNKPQSHESALGFYVTGDPYIGGQGYSLLMCGMDTGYNDNARQRAIVIHGADYVTEKYIQRYGRLGRSFGCPALPPDINRSIIDKIKEGSVVFGYYPDDRYIRNSRILSQAMTNADSILYCQIPLN
jgi:hypothetical protein